MAINLDPLMQVNRQLGYLAGRIALRREIANFIAEKYESATESDKAIYIELKQLLLDSFDKDKYEEEA